MAVTTPSSSVTVAQESTGHGSGVGAGGNGGGVGAGGNGGGVGPDGGGPVVGHGAWRMDGMIVAVAVVATARRVMTTAMNFILMERARMEVKADKWGGEGEEWS